MDPRKPVSRHVADDLRSLKTAYQQADRETMLVALENRHELREMAQ
jgi:hypothetical protein